MKQFRNLRGQLLRFATTALTVSLLITLRVEVPCPSPSGAATAQRDGVTAETKCACGGGNLGT